MSWISNLNSFPLNPEGYLQDGELYRSKRKTWHRRRRQAGHPTLMLLAWMGLPPSKRMPSLNDALGRRNHLGGAKMSGENNWMKRIGWTDLVAGIILLAGLLRILKIEEFSARLDNTTLLNRHNRIGVSQFWEKKMKNTNSIPHPMSGINRVPGLASWTFLGVVPFQRWRNKGGDSEGCPRWRVG